MLCIIIVSKANNSLAITFERIFEMEENDKKNSRIFYLTLAVVLTVVAIIVIAITSLSALIFTEPEMTNGLRWYRLFFMFGASLMGMIGIVMDITGKSAIETEKALDAADWNIRKAIEKGE